MRRVIRALVLVLVWVLAIAEIMFLVGVGIACQGC